MNKQLFNVFSDPEKKSLPCCSRAYQAFNHFCCKQAKIEYITYDSIHLSMNQDHLLKNDEFYLLLDILHVSLVSLFHDFLILFLNLNTLPVRSFQHVHLMIIADYKMDILDDIEKSYQKWYTSIYEMLLMDYNHFLGISKRNVFYYELRYY